MQVRQVQILTDIRDVLLLQHEPPAKLHNLSVGITDLVLLTAE